MGARYVRGDARLKSFLQVTTAQYVDRMDAVGLSGNTIVRASDQAWAAAVGTPAAPTVADGGVAVGSPLTNALTAVKISYQFPWGEGALSAAGTATPTAGAFLKVSGASLVPPAPALHTNVYVETSAGSGVFKLWGVTGGGSTLMIPSYGAGQSPAASAVLSGALQITQYNFAQLYVGQSNQRKCSATGTNQAFFNNNARIFGNSADNQMMVNQGGVFEFDCVSFTFTPGMYIGMAKDTGNALLNQTVVQVANQALAIGIVVEDSNYGGVLQASTKVVAQILGYLNPVPAIVYSGNMNAGVGVMN